jgi:hypothetical protein
MRPASAPIWRFVATQLLDQPTIRAAKIAATRATDLDWADARGRFGSTFRVPAAQQMSAHDRRSGPRSYVAGVQLETFQAHTLLQAELQFDRAEIRGRAFMERFSSMYIGIGVELVLGHSDPW